MPKFTICVTQMVEQLGSFEVEAEDVNAALDKACIQPLFEACGDTWREGDDADKARIYAVLDEAGNLLRDL